MKYKNSKFLFHVIIVLILLMSASCSVGTKTAFDLDLSKYVKEYYYSDVFNSLTYIELETISESIISGIDQLLVDDSLIFILDKRQKAIFIFSDTGKFLNKINKIGKGEGEYITTTSFCICTAEKLIFVLDDMVQKINIYSYNGNFVRTIKLRNEDVIRSIACISNGNLLLFTPDPLHAEIRNGVWETDTEGYFIKQHRTVDPKYKFPYFTYPYYSLLNQQVSFYDFYEDEICIYNNDVISAWIKINLKQKLGQEIHANPEAQYQDGSYRGSGDYYINSDFSETINNYYLQYYNHKHKKYKTVILGKENKSIVIAEYLVNNFDFREKPARFFTYKTNILAGIIWGYEDEKNPTIQLLTDQPIK
jgi:hypothetical protein